MLILAWDSSTPRLSLALARIKPGGLKAPEVLELREGGAESTHSSLLPQLAASVLEKRGLKPQDLSLIAAGRGPGSFTGLRTGLAFAKGLAFGGTAAIGVPTLQAMVFGSGLPDGLFAAAVDARHQEIFACLYRKAGEGVPEALTGVLALRPEGFCAALAKALSELGLPAPAEGAPVSVLGPGAELLPPEAPGFRKVLGPPPLALALAGLGALLFQTEGPERHPLLPLYGRSPEIFKTWTPPSRLKPSGPAG